MADYYYCLGIYLDDAYMEQTCKKRHNCKYYDENFFRNYKHMLDNFDFLVCFENCVHYLPKREEVVVEYINDDNPFKF